ncbi:cytochrome P450 [Dichomitus squalens LYAD-421 SS1]|uniref:Cytochrome P450 n=1 Tax=Dichomitus squalens (strain LYAD-421) TaxID=732165 RepID=R7SX59_DICSQ|nr:cytochrome P450 [Dichomitus squalens LYAD-421 SS1]EJF60310.1 cytochrome P450 [Dichomitus squalens LYAD-421 SS1]
MDKSQATLYGVLAALVAIYVFRWRTNRLQHIPTLGGPSDPVLSYLSAFNYILNSTKILREGYERFKGSAFKVADLESWTVILNGPEMVDEIRKRPDEELSAMESNEEFLQIRYIFGKEPYEDPYHIRLTRDKLTRTLPAIVPDLVDELRATLPEYVPTHGDEWTTIDVTTTTQKIVARLSNRVFVGLPVCRNEEYLKMAVSIATDLIKDAFILKTSPHFLRPIVAWLTSSTRRTVRRALPYLRPVIAERKEQIAEHGLGQDWPGKPNDMLQWIIENEMLRGAEDEAIIARILLVNFQAIHTTSTSITHALYHLAASPEYIHPLREEVQSIIAAEGWTKTALGKMRKLDSFLKESQRYNGISLVAPGRKALKDVRLSDGTVIPAGTMVNMNTHRLHLDDACYPNANEFDPFRFARIREVDGEGTKHQFTHTSNQYVAFGIGRHACPGRFFAATELKALLAYIVINYDLKVAGDGTRPRNLYFSHAILPSMSGKIMLRKCQVEEVT